MSMLNVERPEERIKPRSLLRLKWLTSIVNVIANQRNGPQQVLVVLRPSVSQRMSMDFQIASGLAVRLGFAIKLRN